jgi:hypothetical protein
MSDGLIAARALAEAIRFSADNAAKMLNIESSQIDMLKSDLYQNELRISKEVTPQLFDTFSNACLNLSIPMDSISAFVYASPFIQAECFAGNGHDCAIHFSSSLVDLLDDRELSFVVGHELGHFLLQHSLSLISDRSSFDYYIQRRYQEISADRVGLTACGTLEIAIKALMKIISGLTSKYLTFNITSFISQLKGVEYHGDHAATHPSILIRCRALLWYSLSDYFLKDDSSDLKKPIKELDERILQDFNKYVDGPVHAEINTAKENLAMWMAALKIVENDVFTKGEQHEFAGLFGEEVLASLKNFLKEIPAHEVQDIVFKRIQSAREDLKNLIPNSFELEIKRINQMVEMLNG